MEYYNNRMEIKYILDDQQYLLVNSFLNNFGVLDKYVVKSEGYKINTFYLCSWKTSNRTVKNHGHLRIRKYCDTGKVYLEEKTKIKNRYYKQRVLIDQQEEKLLKSFSRINQIEYFSKSKNIILSNPYYFIADFDKFEVEYRRIAYNLCIDQSTFRATIDSNLKTNGESLLNGNYIFELKINGEFENIVNFFMDKFNLTPCKISKYSILKEYLCK